MRSGGFTLFLRHSVRGARVASQGAIRALFLALHNATGLCYVKNVADERAATERGTKMTELEHKVASMSRERNRIVSIARLHSADAGDGGVAAVVHHAGTADSGSDDTMEVLAWAVDDESLLERLEDLY